MVKIQEVLDTVLSTISLTPLEEKKINSVANEILKKAKKAGLKAQVGGSLAKKTLIKKAKQDVDIFIQFENNKDLDKFYTKAKKLNNSGEFLHGSRDYFTFTEQDILFEIIPVLKFKKATEAENVTDFSLIHVNFIKKELAKNKKLANEIK